jgi:hypothetical protein
MATRSKRNKTRIIFLLPVLAVAFILGLCMYVSGDGKRIDKIQRKIPKKDNVIFLPTIFEEKQEMIISARSSCSSVPK